MSTTLISTCTNRTQSEWKSLIDEWLASGQSSIIFSREKKIAASGLYRWRKYFYPHIKSSRKGRRKEKSNIFIPITLTNDIATSAKITLTYPNGCHLQISSIDLSTLKILNQAMGVV